MEDMVIQTSQLTKKYGDQTTVNQVNLHVKRGRIYGLLGRNGAGKTTIMKMILGLTSATSGSVELFGSTLSGNEKLLYPRIGAMIEAPGFYPNLTGTENLEIFARLRGHCIQPCSETRPGDCGPTLSGQKNFWQIFPWYEAAPWDCQCYFA